MKRLMYLMTICLPLINMQTSVAAESLGRLFSTPEERVHLDNLRELKKHQPAEMETVVEENLIERRPAPLPSPINMQGYVKRHDGKQGTIWINGEALQEQSGNKDVQVGRLPINGNRIPIRLPVNGKRLTLKAGQVYDPETNKIREARAHGAQGDVGTIGYANTP